MNCKQKTIFVALCIAAVSLAGCSDESKPADLTNPVTSAMQNAAADSEELIGLKDAENAALAHAGVSETEAKITKAELDRDNGNYEYEIEFTAQNYKYEYDINAADGSVLKFTKEAVSAAIAETSARNEETSAAAQKPAETLSSAVTAKTDETPPPAVTTKQAVTTDAPTSPAAGTDIITAEEAKSAALKHAGLNASEVTFTKAELDHDDGITEYEIEFYSSENEYEYDINAATGMVIKYSKEALKLPAMKNSSSTITLDEAKAAALEYAGLTDSEVKFTKTELDYDDGRAEYEIEFNYGRKEYEFKIDAYSGDILETEID